MGRGETRIRRIGANLFLRIKSVLIRSIRVSPRPISFEDFHVSTADESCINRARFCRVVRAANDGARVFENSQFKIVDA